MIQIEKELNALVLFQMQQENFLQAAMKFEYDKFMPRSGADSLSRCIVDLGAAYLKMHEQN